MNNGPTKLLDGATHLQHKPLHIGYHNDSRNNLCVISPSTGFKVGYPKSFIILEREYTC